MHIHEQKGVEPAKFRIPNEGISHINEQKWAEPNIFEYLMREMCIFMNKKGWSLPNSEYLMREISHINEQKWAEPSIF